VDGAAPEGYATDTRERHHLHMVWSNTHRGGSEETPPPHGAVKDPQGGGEGQKRHHRGKKSPTPIHALAVLSELKPTDLGLPERVSLSDPASLAVELA